MRRFLHTNALLAVIALVFVVAAPLHAQEIKNPIAAEEFRDIICAGVTVANTLIAPLSVLMILIAAFLYMTGGGNPEKVKTAHKVLIWALVGIAVVLLANSGIAIVTELFGGQPGRGC